MRNNPYPVRIWDWPTRLFHWLLVICVVGAFVCVKLGGLYMDWHTRFGYAILGLIVFRLVWGFIGPRYARFTQFIRGPRAIAHYLKHGALVAGHNPLGALSVLALLLGLGFQAVSGLFATDDILTQGPLFDYVSNATAAQLTAWHQLNEWVILGLITLHLLAILWYGLRRRKRLVRAMITGDVDVKDLPLGTQATQDEPSIWIRAGILAASITALLWGLCTLA